MQRRVPLAYFFGTAEGWYEAIWPVYAVGDNPARRTFTFTAELQGRLPLPPEAESEATVTDQRRYATREVQQRQHQRVFRGLVIKAYASRCTVCQLRRRELLEAAHILGDTDPRGQPVVSNGLAMCSLHHSAYDMNVIGITPDCVIQIRRDVMDDTDGPMLTHGLQGFQGNRLVLPHHVEERPNRDFLAERYDEFRRAG